jgi:hypothetical protein
MTISVMWLHPYSSPAKAIWAIDHEERSTRRGWQGMPGGRAWRMRSLHRGAWWRHLITRKGHQGCGGEQPVSVLLVWSGPFKESLRLPQEFRSAGL